MKNPNKIKAVSLYDLNMESSWPEDKRTPNSGKHFVDEGPKLVAEPYQSKYSTSYQPKSHYRYDQAYNLAVDDDMAKRRNTEPTKRKTVPDDGSAATMVAEEDRKKSFISWVMNGLMNDMGQSENLLFKPKD